MTSISEPDLSQSSSLIVSSSEEELPNLEKKYSEKSGMMTYAKELINNMWTNFSVLYFYTLHRRKDKKA